MFETTLYVKLSEKYYVLKIVLPATVSLKSDSVLAHWGTLFLN